MVAPEPLEQLPTRNAPATSTRRARTTGRSSIRICWMTARRTPPALREYDIVTLQDDTRTNCSGWSEEGRAAFSNWSITYSMRSRRTVRVSSTALIVPPQSSTAPITPFCGSSSTETRTNATQRFSPKCGKRPPDPRRSVLLECDRRAEFRTPELNENHPLDLSRDGDLFRLWSHALLRIGPVLPVHSETRSGRTYRRAAIFSAKATKPWANARPRSMTGPGR